LTLQGEAAMTLWNWLGQLLGPESEEGEQGPESQLAWTSLSRRADGRCLFDDSYFNEAPGPGGEPAQGPGY
jgi:hypothetical protein